MSDPLERQSMEVDIACVGFGPATAGFLSTLSRQIVNPDGSPAVESRSTPGLPLQVVCYERADDIGFGVSGVVTRARGIRATIPTLDAGQIPMAAAVRQEKVVYLLDPSGASRRSTALKLADRALRLLGLAKRGGFELPYVPPFLHKNGGMVMSLGQFMQFVGAELMGSGTVQIWPGSPVESALVEDGRVCGVRLLEQGMDVRAALTVVGDGPVGAVGRQLDAEFGMPPGHHHREWAVGMKMVVDLPEGVDLEPGTVYHTFGYPEPEIFGFLYVHPDRVATVGIFVPSWFRSPMRTSYRYLQHFMLHPYIWRHLKGGKLRSWGAKSLQESGRRGEPFLAGPGYARIGEGSGSTNVLTGSGVDEAWTTGSQLAEAVLDLLKHGEPLNQENIERTYVARRRASWVEEEGRVAEKARDGFHKGVVTGLMGMALAGFTKGKQWIEGDPQPIPELQEYYRDRIPSAELDKIVADCRARSVSCHDALMERCGWPPIPYDGQLLVTHQDALLIGGKVQAPAGFPDHVTFEYPDFCERCESKLCIEACSGQAIAPGPAGGVPTFDREKCVHCGACLWNCMTQFEDDPPRGNIAFRAGAGGIALDGELISRSREIMVGATMPLHRLRFFFPLALCASCLAAGMRADTARLAQRLKPLRIHKVMALSAAEFDPVRDEYLAWIDSRMKAGTSVARMNAELTAAGLLSDGPKTVDDEFDRTYAGYLGKVETKAARPAADLGAISFGVHTGGYCNFDETVVLYMRNPYRRVARINAEQAFTHGYYLREIAVGKDDPARGRIIGSGWVASNCTSNWNGEVLRIDLLHRQSLENVLDKGVGAFSADPMRIDAVGDTITFSYTGSAHDSEVLTRDAIARYRVQAGRAIRVAPIAPSFGGFIDEWLGMDDAEAARWSSPDAAAQHHDAAVRYNADIFTWEHVADCSGPPLAREIAVRWDNLKQTTVFLISASRAEEMQMLSVSDKLSPSCREVDISKGLQSIMATPSK